MMLALVWNLKPIFEAGILLALILIAMWRGAGPERWSAAVFIGMFVLDRIYHFILGRGAQYGTMDIGHFCIDLIATIAFVTIALRANRIYPLCLSALQVIAIISHVIRAISPAIAGGAYSILMIVPSYLQTAVFGTGLYLHLRRVQKFPHYPSWLVFSPHSQGQEPRGLQGGSLPDLGA